MLKCVDMTHENVHKCGMLFIRLPIRSLCTAFYLLSTKQPTDTIRDQSVNTVEHLAAKDPDI